MIDQPFSVREIVVFQNNCEAYFKTFRVEGEGSDSDSSQTEQIESQREGRQEEKQRQRLPVMPRD